MTTKEEYEGRWRYWNGYRNALIEVKSFASKDMLDTLNTMIDRAKSNMDEAEEGTNSFTVKEE